MPPAPYFWFVVDAGPKRCNGPRNLCFERLKARKKRVEIDYAETMEILSPLLFLWISSSSSPLTFKVVRYWVGMDGWYSTAAIYCRTRASQAKCSATAGPLNGARPSLGHRSIIHVSVLNPYHPIPYCTTFLLCSTF